MVEAAFRYGSNPSSFFVHFSPVVCLQVALALDEIAGEHTEDGYRSPGVADIRAKEE